jgi:hypothetical protein
MNPHRDTQTGDDNFGTPNELRSVRIYVTAVEEPLSTYLVPVCEPHNF